MKTCFGLAICVGWLMTLVYCAPGFEDYRDNPSNFNEEFNMRIKRAGPPFDRSPEDNWEPYNQRRPKNNRGPPGRRGPPNDRRPPDNWEPPYGRGPPNNAGPPYNRGPPWYREPAEPRESLDNAGRKYANKASTYGDSIKEETDSTTKEGTKNPSNTDHEILKNHEDKEKIISVIQDLLDNRFRKDKIDKPVTTTQPSPVTNKPQIPVFQAIAVTPDV